MNGYSKCYIETIKLTAGVEQDTIVKLEDYIRRSATSCYYGWYPPVYRTYPAFNLLNKIYGILSSLEGSKSIDIKISEEWLDKALSIVNCRIHQLELNRSLYQSTSQLASEIDQNIDDVYSYLVNVRAEFQKQTTHHFSSAYALLCDLISILDHAYSLVDDEGMCFPEPNNPWDIWIR